MLLRDEYSQITRSLLPLPQSPVLHVSMISHCDSRRKHCRVSGTPFAIDGLCAICDDDAAPPGPFAMVAAAYEREASFHPIAAWHSPYLSGRRRGGTGGASKSLYVARANLLVEKAGGVAAVAADHRAPSD